MQKTESLDGKPIRPSARTGSTFNVLLKIQNAVHSLSGKLRASLNSLPFWPAVALIFTLMIIYNYDHIFNPPHWDDMIGLHNQALFLAKHHFNFWELWHEKVTIHPYFNIGEGSNIYPYSVVALFWAVLYRWLEPSWAHCTGHIVYMLCLALSGGLFFNTLRRLSVSGVWAAVFTLLAFLEPIMSGRTAAIGQECPLILGTMLAVFFWAKQQTRKAVVTAALSIFLRDTAGIFVIVILLTAFMEWILTHWNNRNSARRKWEICGIVLALVLMGLYVVYILTTRKTINGLTALNLAGHVGRTLWVHIPYISGLWFLAFVLLVTHTAGAVKRQVLQTERRQYLFYWGLLAVYGAILFCMIFIVCNLPRYMSAAVFPIFLVLGRFWPKGRAGIAAVGILFLILSIQPFPPAHPFLTRSGELLERNRDYLQDVKANQNLCAYLEQQQYGRTIVAKWPYILMFTVPEFGYVSKPLPNVYVAEWVAPNYAPVKVYTGKETLPGNPLFIFTPTSLGHTILSLLPNVNDPILYMDDLLGGSVVVFQRQVTHRKPLPKSVF